MSRRGMLGAMAEGTQSGSLRDRKRRRAEEAIRKAALELFSERGYDQVSVTEIAERAEVGRTTFFRYFGDKQEVLFPDPAQESAEAVAGVGRPGTAIGASLSAALRSVRAIVTAFVGHITADPADYDLHQRLVRENPELYARSLVKQRRYADLLTAQLRGWGADPVIARQAAELGLACFYAAQAESADDPRTFQRHLAHAFDRLELQSSA
jgi:AcrR family transcriptional regulator